MGSGYIPEAPITNIVHDDRGRRVHTFRQSSLHETLDICMERGRLKMSGLMPDRTTDAMAMGTAVHKGIELELLAKQAGDFLGPDAIVDTVLMEFEEATKEDSFAGYEKYRNWDNCETGIRRAIYTWYTELYDELDPVAVERKFDPLLLCEDDERVIYVSSNGIDAVANGKIWDWKTTDRAYEPWEYQRWAMQPTIYTYAWAKLNNRLDETMAFNYFVMFTRPTKIRGESADSQLVSVTRGPADWAWLADKCVSLAKLIEADLDQWPLQDNTALCSPAYCSNWVPCKGKHYQELDWPSSAKG